MEENMAQAIIDIGTNSVRLFIPNQTNLLNSKKFMRITRIGENVDKNRYLLEAAMERTIKGLEELMEICKEEHVTEIVALATSAVRDAENAQVFIDRVQSRLGLAVEVISGNLEAELGFMGAIGGLVKPEGDYLIIDIGGGSTELIDARNGEIIKMKSFDIGVVRLTEMFELSDPPKDEEIHALRGYVKELLSAYLKNCTGKLVGIGGTITTLSAVDHEVAVYDRAVIHGSVITKNRIQDILDEFMIMTNDARKYVPGLDEKRADIIIAGIEILLAIMELMNEEEIIVSDYDNLEGYYLMKFLVDKA
jgi:exopolyphosphatase/guanosine-5'-triphosphate,3'-diphosphate pyrophosphatase